VSVISTATNTLTATIPVTGSPGQLAVSPDGTRLYVARPGFGNVTVIDTSSNTIIAGILGAGTTDLTVSPDGTRLYIVNSGQDAVLVNTAANTVVATIPVGDFPVLSVPLYDDHGGSFRHLGCWRRFGLRAFVGTTNVATTVMQPMMPRAGPNDAGHRDEWASSAK
jgi:YVTN family beta-propeller protein